MSVVETVSFYLVVVLIVVIAVFPFYYAIITSLKTGTALFEVQNYIDVFSSGEFPRNIANSVLVRR